MRRRLLPLVAVLLIGGGVALAVLGVRTIDLERGAAEREARETARTDLAQAQRRLATLGVPDVKDRDDQWVVVLRAPEDPIAAAPEEVRLRFEEAEFRERRGEVDVAIEILSRIVQEAKGDWIDVAAVRAGTLAARKGDAATARPLLEHAAHANAGQRTPEGPRVRLVARRQLTMMDPTWVGRLVSAAGPFGPSLAAGAWLDDADTFVPGGGGDLRRLKQLFPGIGDPTGWFSLAERAAKGRAALRGLGDRRIGVVDGELFVREPWHPESELDPWDVPADRLVAFRPATLAAWLGARTSPGSHLGFAASLADVPEGAEAAAAGGAYAGLTLVALPPPLPLGSTSAAWVLAAGILAYAVGGGLSLVAAARARRAARMQADFVAAVSHEMKTPIAAVQAMAEMLADERVADPVRARVYAERMRAEMVRLGATVRNVLDAARIERGEGARVAPRPMDPSTVVEDLAAVVRPVLEARGYRFLVAAVPSPVPVATDPDALASVLTNLLDNAAKFAAAGREVAVEAGPTATGYRVAVLDRGPGVPEGERERVFERFHRGQAAREGAIPGVGLGLHVARELVKAHGGTIRVEEREGGGAVFVVEWPREGAA